MAQFDGLRFTFGMIKGLLRCKTFENLWLDKDKGKC